MKKLGVFLLLACFYANLFAGGFLTTQGKKIVDGDGNEIYFRGVGLGGWMVPEGYMLQTSGFANSPKEIRAKIVELIGEAETENFYEKYEANYVTRKDMEKLAEFGFNSIRLPFHYDVLTPPDQPGVYLEEGWAMFDSLLAWCKDNEMYLILDMHCAPGGQSDDNISDYDPNEPALWESEANKTRTVEIWKKIAERYKDEEWIGGYDLLNEPKWDLQPNNLPLMQLYQRITTAIREVDNNHIVFIEGNWYATDFGGLTPPFDSKMVYSFHKYWNSNEQGTIQYLLDLRNNTNVPLWLGETGENSNTWFTEVIQLMEANNIGYAFWPHKKFDSISGIFTADVTPQYQQLLDYWGGSGTQPSPTFAKAALLGMAENLKVENCTFHKDVVDAMFRQVESNQAIPFTENEAPGIVYAVDYDMGRRGVAYQDEDYQNLNGNGGSTWNQGWAYRNDGVDIEACEDTITNGYNVGWISNGEWMKYTVNVKYPGTYKLKLRATSNSGGCRVRAAINGIPVGQLVTIHNTGGWQNWENFETENFDAAAGNVELMIQAVVGDFNLNYIEFVPVDVNDIDEDGVGKVDTYELFQNYPNPFNGGTVIKFYTPEETKATVKVFDVTGELVKTISTNELVKGTVTYKWNPTEDISLSSGVYFLNVKMAGQVFTKKMLYLK